MVDNATAYMENADTRVTGLDRNSAGPDADLEGLDAGKNHLDLYPTSYGQKHSQANEKLRDLVSLEQHMGQNKLLGAREYSSEAKPIVKHFERIRDDNIRTRFMEVGFKRHGEKMRRGDFS